MELLVAVKTEWHN